MFQRASWSPGWWLWLGSQSTGGILISAPFLRLIPTKLKTEIRKLRLALIWLSCFPLNARTLRGKLIGEHLWKVQRVPCDLRLSFVFTSSFPDLLIEWEFRGGIASFLELLIFLLALGCMFRIVQKYKALVFELIPLVFSLGYCAIKIFQNSMEASIFGPYVSIYIQSLIYFVLCIFFINTGTRLRNHRGLNM